MMRFELPALLDLPATALLAETLRDQAGPVILDGAAVERIGIAGLQLLLSAYATAAAAGQGMVLDTPSAALCAAVRTAGADFILAPAC